MLNAVDESVAAEPNIISAARNALRTGRCLDRLPFAVCVILARFPQRRVTFRRVLRNFLSKTGVAGTNYFYFVSSLIQRSDNSGIL